MVGESVIVSQHPSPSDASGVSHIPAWPTLHSSKLTQQPKANISSHVDNTVGHEYVGLGVGSDVVGWEVGSEVVGESVIAIQQSGPPSDRHSWELGSNSHPVAAMHASLPKPSQSDWAVAL